MPQLPLVNVSSRSVVISLALPAASTDTWDFTGPTAGAAQVFTSTLVPNLPTFVDSTMSTTEAR